MRFIKIVSLVFIGLFFSLNFFCSKREKTIQNLFSSAPELYFDLFSQSTIKTLTLKLGVRDIVQDTIHYLDSDADALEVKATSFSPEIKIFGNTSEQKHDAYTYSLNNKQAGTILLSMDVANVTSDGMVLIACTDELGANTEIKLNVKVIDNLLPVVLQPKITLTKELDDHTVYSFDFSESFDQDKDLGGGILYYGIEINKMGTTLSEFNPVSISFQNGADYVLKFFVVDSNNKTSTEIPEYKLSLKE